MTCPSFHGLFILPTNTFRTQMWSPEQECLKLSDVKFRWTDEQGRSLLLFSKNALKGTIGQIKTN